MTDANQLPVFVTLTTPEGGLIEVNPQAIDLIERITTLNQIPATQLTLRNGVVRVVLETATQISEQTIANILALTSTMMEGMSGMVNKMMGEMDGFGEI